MTERVDYRSPVSPQNNIPNATVPALAAAVVQNRVTTNPTPRKGGDAGSEDHPLPLGWEVTVIWICSSHFDSLQILDNACCLSSPRFRGRGCRPGNGRCLWTVRWYRVLRGQRLRFRIHLHNTQVLCPMLPRRSNNPPIRSVLNLIPGRHRQFEAAKNAYGVFAFQGDTLVWSAADIARPNLAAWLVCEGREVFVNTGAFLYDTPAGCFDHTIHSYGVVALVIDGGRARI